MPISMMLVSNKIYNMHQNNNAQESPVKYTHKIFDFT